MINFFVIFSDIVVSGSITVDCKFRNFLEVFEAVSETEEVLHLHFLIEFDKGVVKFMQLLSLVLFGDVYFFDSAGFFQLPICTNIDFDAITLHSDSSMK